MKNQYNSLSSLVLVLSIIAKITLLTRLKLCLAQGASAKRINMSDELNDFCYTSHSLRVNYKHVLGLVLVTTLINTISFGMTTNEKVPFLIQGGIGSLVGVTEVFINQPLIYLKNTIQQRKKISCNPRIFYRGLGIGIACMAPTTAIQLATENALKKFFPTNDIKTTTTRALLAGAFSAIASTPTELIVLHQQNSGYSALKTTKNLIAIYNPSIIYRGVLAKSLRDAIFCAGFLSVSPYLNRYFEKKINNKSLSSIMSCIVTGTITAIISHPFDTISTLMQANCDTPKTFIETGKILLKNNGIFGFYQGLIPRNIRICLALLVMEKARKLYTDKVLEILN